MASGFFEEDKIDVFDEESGDLHAIIETPQGSRNKYKLDLQMGQFTLDKILPVGLQFPFDFGFIPSTRGEDGDPLDLLLLTDEPTFTGCLVCARLIGVLEAEQTEEGKTIRNDRLIAVVSVSREHKDIKELSQLNSTLVKEIEDFFVAYNAEQGKRFKPLGRKGAQDALKLLDQGMELFKKDKKRGGRKSGKNK